jgi:predicted TPR repeat methyltransferase
VSSAVNPKLALAIAKHQQGLWQEAEKLYQEILADDADNADALHLTGILYGQIGQFATAKEFLERALTLSPDSATFHNSMANIKKNLQDYDSAITHYKTAIKLNPKSTTAQNNLAVLMTLQGNLAQAKLDAEKILALNQNDPEAHYTMALIALKEDNSSHALIELHKTLELNPEHLQARYTLAQQLQYANHNNNLRATEQNPGNLMTQSIETNSLSALEEAIQHYEAVLKAQPNFSDALVNYAAALLMQNKKEEAVKIFYRALEADPDHYEAHYNLGCALLEQQELKIALEHFLKAISKKPTVEAYYNIGLIYSYQDRHGEALAYLKKAIAIDPLYFAAYNNLATVYLKLDDLPNAIENFEAALRIQPQNEEIAYILSALRQEKVPDRAPKSYVEHLFDQYAPNFDKHLVEHLKYETPKLLHNAVMNVIRDNHHLRKVLDLGCGTGLAGELFLEIASPLIGVDLSSKMIEIVKQKGIYDELLVADIHDALKDHKDNELIIAADVLTYLGDLSELFAAVHKALTSNGLFAFTIEVAPETVKTYSLQTSIRYAHSPPYIQELAAQNHLSIVTQNKITLRLQHNKPLEGMLFVVTGVESPDGY